MEKYKYLKKHKILEKCPKCTRENYIFNVLYGICTWCGFDINNEQLNIDEKTTNLKENK